MVVLEEFHFIRQLYRTTLGIHFSLLTMNYGGEHVHAYEYVSVVDQKQESAMVPPLPQLNGC
jgi:hypothetical protein